MTIDETDPQKLQSLSQALIALQDDAFLEVLRLVFSKRIPYPEESAWHNSCYFLGIASNLLEDESDGEGGPVAWSGWSMSAAAYPDLSKYESWQGPEDGFAEGGQCQSCSVIVRGIVKHGICPVCGDDVYMT